MGTRHPAYVSASHRIPAARTRHPKYLHCPVAKLESNRFEMTFHLTKHKSGGPYAPTTLAPTRWLVRPARTMSFLLLSLSLSPPSVLTLPLSFSHLVRGPSTSDFHGPSGGGSRNIALWAAVCQPDNRLDGNCYCALISRMSRTSRDEFPQGGFMRMRAYLHEALPTVNRCYLPGTLFRPIVAQT